LNTPIPPPLGTPLRYGELALSAAVVCRFAFSCSEIVPCCEERCVFDLYPTVHKMLGVHNCSGCNLLAILNGVGLYMIL